MRAVIQRVKNAWAEVDQEIIGSIGAGLLVLIAIHKDDTEKDLDWMVDKIINLRIFDDKQGLMNYSLLDMGGELLVVSQFTILGDCRKGRRPSWSNAAPPDIAKLLYQSFITLIRNKGITCATGRFQAMMNISLVNNGPVTLVIDSRQKQH